MNPIPDLRQIIASVEAIDTAARERYLRELIQKHSPVDTGALRRSWNDPRTVQILPTGVVEIDNPLPYARIQDVGGTIPKYDIIKAKGPGHVMRAVINGKVRYFTKRGPIKIKAQHYVRAAVQEFNSSLAGQIAPLKVSTRFARPRLAGLVGAALAILAGRREQQEGAQ